MKTNLIHIAHTPRLRAAYRYGRSRVDYLHVAASFYEIVRELRGILTPAGRVDRALRADRHALYLGGIAGHRANRALVRAFAL